MHDARFNVGLPSHPKTKRLMKRFAPQGGAAAWGLVCLILWTRQNRPTGDLSGLTDEDLELAIDWQGENGALIRELATVKFLEGAEETRRFHDWEDHQPWAAGQTERSKSSTWSALVRHHGKEGAIAKMPDYYESHIKPNKSDAKLTEKNAKRTASQESASKTDAPSPSPSPSPFPSPQNPPIAPQGADGVSPPAVESSSDDLAQVQQDTPASEPPAEEFDLETDPDEQMPNTLAQQQLAVSAKKKKRAAVEAIYEAYPKKVGRDKALESIAKRLKNGMSADVLLAKVELYAKAVDTWPPSDRQFVPNPATWFNQGRFADDPQTWLRGSINRLPSEVPAKKEGAAVASTAPAAPEGWQQGWVGSYGDIPCPEAWHLLSAAQKADVRGWLTSTATTTPATEGTDAP